MQLSDSDNFSSVTLRDGSVSYMLETAEKDYEVVVSGDRMFYLVSGKPTVKLLGGHCLVAEHYGLGNLQPWDGNWNT